MDYFDLEKISQSFGDAFYLLDSNRYKSNFNELKGSFTSFYPKFNIAYSYKTNYTPKLCKIVDDLGGYAEVVSEMELDIALKLGIRYENIIWNGPLKNRERMKQFLLSGGLINIDNEEEFIYILDLVETYPNNIFNLGIRCNFDVGDGVLSRFGIDIDTPLFNKVVKTFQCKKNINFVNLQCHFAKRQLQYWEPRIRGMLAIIDMIGITPQRIDIGGGLYGKMPESMISQFTTEIPSYNDYARVVGPIIFDKFKYLSIDDMPELVIEPGTALVGDCMSFIGRISNIKKIRGKNFATILGSKFNINMSGINPPIKVYHSQNTNIAYKDLDIVGFTCIEADVLYTNYDGLIGTGDFVEFNNVGSYSIVMKPPFILPNFPIIEISGNMIELIKEQETFDDLFHTFVF